MLRITTELAKSERDRISTSVPSLFSMSPNRTIVSVKSKISSPLAAAQPLTVLSAQGATHCLAPGKLCWPLSSPSSLVRPSYARRIRDSRLVGLTLVDSWRYNPRDVLLLQAVQAHFRAMDCENA